MWTFFWWVGGEVSASQHHQPLVPTGLGSAYLWGASNYFLLPGGGCSICKTAQRHFCVSPLIGSCLCLGCSCMMSAGLSAWAALAMLSAWLSPLSLQAWCKCCSNSVVYPDLLSKQASFSASTLFFFLLLASLAQFIIMYLFTYM